MTSNPNRSNSSAASTATPSSDGFPETRRNVAPASGGGEDLPATLAA
jgi:hypothetical protein